MSELNLKIVSNRGILLEDKVNMVVLPGFFGDIGITVSDRIFVYLLKTGILYLFKDGKEVSRYFIFGGRFKLEGEDLVIATDSFLVDLSDINHDKINGKITDLEQSIKNSNDEILIKNYQTQIENYKMAILSENIRTYK